MPVVYASTIRPRELFPDPGLSERPSTPVKPERVAEMAASCTPHDSPTPPNSPPTITRCPAFSLQGQGELPAHAIPKPCTCSFDNTDLLLAIVTGVLIGYMLTTAFSSPLSLDIANE